MADSGKGDFLFEWSKFLELLPVWPNHKRVATLPCETFGPFSAPPCYKVRNQTASDNNSN